MIKDNLYFQICQLPLSDCAVKKSLPTIFCVIWILAILWILHPFAYATSQRARLSSQPDIRQRYGKFANHSLQFVCVCVIWFIWICGWRSFWAGLFIDCNFLHRFADALFEPASVCVCVKHLSICLCSLRTGDFICVCVFAVARSEPAFVVYICLLTLFLSEHLLSTRRRYFAFAPKLTLTVVNLDSLHQTILFDL